MNYTVDISTSIYKYQEMLEVLNSTEPILNIALRDTIQKPLKVRHKKTPFGCFKYYTDKVVPRKKLGQK